MAGKRRTLDPELFSKSEFRRATYVQREMWIGIIATCCDDEGRFEADAWNLSELIFSRSHDANEEAVTEALAYWCQCGWLLLYEDGRYGFLTGWYEHQYIRDPEPSSLPPPPAQVNSWRVVMGIKEWFMEQRKGGGNTHFRTILREFEQSLLTDSSLSAYLVRTESVVSKGQKGREGKLEGKGKEKDSLSLPCLPTQQGDPTPPPPTNGRESALLKPIRLQDDLPPQLPATLGMMKQTYPCLFAAIQALHPDDNGWSLRRCEEFFAECVRNIEAKSSPVPEADVMRWLTTDKRKPAFSVKAPGWVAYQLSLDGKEQRAQGRASPNAAKYAPTTQAAFAAAAAAREAQTSGKGDAA